MSANRHFTSSNGKDWGNWAKIFTDHGNGHYNDASSAVWPERGASYEAPPGWLGAQAMKRDGNGNVVCVDAWAYNSVTASSLQSYGCSGTIHAVYSSQGSTRVWTGSAYEAFWTFLSPNQDS